MKFGELQSQAKHIRDVLLRKTFDEPMIADTGWHRGPFWREAEKLALPGACGETACGVYVITSEGDGEVLYIGGSTSGNIDWDVWSKLGTPAATSVPGRRCFPATAWSEKNDIEEKAQKAIFDGAFDVDAISIRPLDCVELYAVYLRTFCRLREGRLPPLNGRIG